MVDPKNDELTEAGLDQVARRVWVKPRLETIEITDTQAATPPPGPDASTSTS